jgi:hypothetical protein
MALRELLYFDRERIESYISQLAGGLTVQESTQQTGSEKLSGGLKASIKILELQSGAEQSATSASTTTRVPAHAILDYLEALLCEAHMLADAGNHLVLPGQIATMRGDATFESWGLLAELADSKARMISRSFASASADLRSSCASKLVIRRYRARS